MKKTDYKKYFKEHYNYNLEQKDILNYYQWFYSQWEIIKKDVKLNKKIEILEIGSGVGGFFFTIKDQINQKNYTGIELDPDVVKFSNDFFKTNVFKCTSLEKFTSKKKYDYIFGFEVLEHVNNPIEVINIINSLLKKNGKFIGTTPYPFKKNIEADNTHLFVLHPFNWERLFSQSNFKIERIEPMSFFPFLWRISKYLNIRINYYLPFPSFISTSLIIAKKAKP